MERECTSSSRTARPKSKSALPPLIISTMKNYRNYSEFEYDFSNNKTLIVGKNAQGKTNILEAVYYLCAIVLA